MDGVKDDQEYCRTLEAYLCRKNGGHLIRIVGPSFDLVSGWAERGVPMSVACRGIDRYFERAARKGPQRRPARIEFCEADVLDVFDEWRRVVGVTGTEPVSSATGDEDGEPAGPLLRRSLPAHVDRALARLADFQARGDTRLDDLLETLRPELEAMRASGKGARGQARQAIIARLRVLDADVLRTVRGRTAAEALSQLAADAGEELAAFRSRMAPDAYERSLTACIDRLIRERAGLPTLTFD
jgi:hypothetical protein